MLTFVSWSYYFTVPDASFVCMSYILHCLMNKKIERNSMVPKWGIGRKENLASRGSGARYMGEKERKEPVDIL